MIPGPRRALSPLGISVAQRCAQLAKRTTELAMSGVGHITGETCHARGIVEAAITKARFVHDEVESRIASLEVQAEASMAQVEGAVSKRIKEMAAHSEAETLRVVGSIAQRLEKEIEATAVSAAMMSERNMRMAVDDVRKEVQVQLVQNRVDLERRHEKTKKTVEKVAVGLEELTRQLNAYKPASAENVGDVQKNLSEQVAQKLSVQQQRMDLLSHSLEEQKKSVTDSTELLKDLMIGIENLGYNMKNIQQKWTTGENQKSWRPKKIWNASMKMSLF